MASRGTRCSPVVYLASAWRPPAYSPALPWTPPPPSPPPPVVCLASAWHPPPCCLPPWPRAAVTMCCPWCTAQTSCHACTSSGRWTVPIGKDSWCHHFCCYSLASTWPLQKCARGALGRARTTLYEAPWPIGLCAELISTPMERTLYTISQAFGSVWYINCITYLLIMN